MKILNSDFFGQFIPHETLCYYDGPMIFTVLANDKMYYAHIFDQHSEPNVYTEKFWVREISEQELKDMKDNKIFLAEFIKKGNPLYTIEEKHVERKIINVTVTELQEGDLEKVETDYFPTNDCTLNP